MVKTSKTSNAEQASALKNEVLSVMHLTAQKMFE